MGAITQLSSELSIHSFLSALEHQLPEWVGNAILGPVLSHHFTANPLPHEHFNFDAQAGDYERRAAKNWIASVHRAVQPWCEHIRNVRNTEGRVSS